MRFAHLIAIILGLTLSACDEMPKIVMPGTQLACCCGVGKACPTPAVAAPVVTAAPATMAPEASPVRRVSHVVHRHRAHRVHGPVRINQMAEVNLSGGAQRIVMVERREHHEETFSRSQAWSESTEFSGSGHSHASEEDCDCGPRPAAGRDPSGFLTWPGKAPGHP